MDMRRYVEPMFSSVSALLVAAVVMGPAGMVIAQTVCQQPSATADAKSPQPWRAGKAIVFQTNDLAVDADGAPDSYLVDGKGLSDTCDGVAAIVNSKRVTRKTDPEHWFLKCRKAWTEAQASGDFSHVAIFGFLKDEQNRPVVQSVGDPLPGKAYITTTTLTIPETRDGTQRHWVDATKIPYVVLPKSLTNKSGVAPGDLAIVFRPKTGAIAFGVFGDAGDLGEASVKLHRDLRNEPTTKRAGVTRANKGIHDPVVTLVFPGISVQGSQDAETWNHGIQQSGEAALEKWGGIARLQACSKDLQRATFR